MWSVLFCVDKDGAEIISGTSKMERVDDERWLPEPFDWDDYGDPIRSDDWINVPKGTIKKLIGRDLTWEDEPVEWFGDENKNTPEVTKTTHKIFKPFDKVWVKDGDKMFPDFYSYYNEESKLHVCIGGWGAEDYDIFPYEEHATETTEVKKVERIKEEKEIKPKKSEYADWKLLNHKYAVGEVVSVLDNGEYIIRAKNSWNFVLENVNDKNDIIKVEYANNGSEEPFVLKHGDEIFVSDDKNISTFVDLYQWKPIRFFGGTKMFEKHNGGRICCDKHRPLVYKYLIPKNHFYLFHSNESYENNIEKIKEMKNNIYTIDGDLILRKNVW